MKFDYFRKSAEEMLGSLLLLTAVGLSPGGSGYFTCIQNMKLVLKQVEIPALDTKIIFTQNPQCTLTFGFPTMACVKIQQTLVLRD